MRGEVEPKPRASLLERSSRFVARAVRRTNSPDVGGAIGLVLNILNLALLLPVLVAVCQSLWVPPHMRLATLVFAPMMGASMFQAIHAWGSGRTPNPRRAQRLTIVAAVFSVGLLGCHELLFNTCLITLPADAGEAEGKAIFRALWLSGEVHERAAAAGGVYALAVSEPAWFRQHAVEGMPWALTFTAGLFTLTVAAVAMGISATAGFARLSLTQSAIARLQPRSKKNSPSEEALTAATDTEQARRRFHLRLARWQLLAHYLRGNVVLIIVLACINMAVFGSKAAGLFSDLWLPAHIKEPALILVPLVGIVIFQFVYSLHVAQEMNPFIKHLLVISASCVAIVLLLGHHYLYSKCLFEVEKPEPTKVYLSVLLPPRVASEVEARGSRRTAVEYDPYQIEDWCRYECPWRISFTSFLFAASFGGVVAAFAAAVAFAGELFLEYSLHTPAAPGVPWRVGERVVAQGIEAVTEPPHTRPRSEPSWLPTESYPPNVFL